MKVVHVESGLGNQMLDYCEYLAMQFANPSDKCYIENIIYEIPECDKVISQWNGYELERIFNLKIPNIKEVFIDEEWCQIIKSVKDTKFWEDSWNYAEPIVNAFSKQGVVLANHARVYRYGPIPTKKSIFERFRQSMVGIHVSRILKIIFKKHIISKKCDKENVFCSSTTDIYTGHYLAFMRKGHDIEKIDSQIRQSFVFPSITDSRNADIKDIITKCNSVSIHARRGDLLSVNGFCYKNGYFKRAIHFIKQNVENPVFFFFCDKKSDDWCRDNLSIFGLDKNKDKIYFVNWNIGFDSFRDMQLMSLCKHNVITTSSFGWWATYLNNNPEKITCSPDVKINTTHSF